MVSFSNHLVICLSFEDYGEIGNLSNPSVVKLRSRPIRILILYFNISFDILLIYIYLKCLVFF